MRFVLFSKISSVRMAVPVPKLNISTFLSSAEIHSAKPYKSSVSYGQGQAKIFSHHRLHEDELPSPKHINLHLFLYTDIYEPHTMKKTATNTLISGTIPFIANVANGVRIGFIKNTNDPIIAPPFSIALK